MELSGSSRLDKGDKLKYYEVLFPNDISFLFSAKESIDEFIQRFSSARGVKTYSGAIYNPKQYVNVRSVDTPDPERVILSLPKVIIE